MTGRDPTPRQLEILQFIDSQAIPPSYREIAAHCGYRSVRGVAVQVKTLERKGLLKLNRSGRRKSRSLVTRERSTNKPQLRLLGSINSETGGITWMGPTDSRWHHVALTRSITLPQPSPPPRNP